MAISYAEWGVYGKIRQNVDHLSKKIIHYCISLKVMAKTELWPIFLCIFSNFLCIYKMLVQVHAALFPNVRLMTVLELSIRSATLTVAVAVWKNVDHLSRN